MAGGMRFDGDDIRKMPLRMQEQLGTAILAQMSKTDTVAEKRECQQKVMVRKLRFKNRNLAMRYLALRPAANQGMIYDLILRKEGGIITSISYGITYS